ncbi:MAG TPA: prolyl oligopeptidase family serine peptidase [Fimbriimonadaceae bacterium]|nr:prolyl oligopeptidase family serine peptidase [Fimbriimonadaceae bacterium]
MKLLRPLLAIAALALSLVVQAQEHLVDVIYGHKMGMALTMDVFEPAKANGIGVLWMVSGGWSSSQSSINPGLAKVFTDRGMTVFEVCHGSQPKFQIPEILSDINRAVRFIRHNAATYHVDPMRLGISGGSSGGHLSLMQAVYGGPGDPGAKDPVDGESSAVEAVACFFPPTDMLNWGKTGGKASDNKLLIDVFGAAFSSNKNPSAEEMDKMEHDYSPIYGVTAKMPPTFIMHGDKDPLVPLQQSELFMAKLQELGVPHELVVKPGGGHSWPDIGNDLPKLADWFEKYLGKK